MLAKRIYVINYHSEVNIDFGVEYCIPSSGEEYTLMLQPKFNELGEVVALYTADSVDDYAFIPKNENLTELQVELELLTISYRHEHGNNPDLADAVLLL